MARESDTFDQQLPRRKSRAPSRSRSRKRSPPPQNDNSSSSNPSPGSWDVQRGRTRVRKPDNALSEENLRRRGYHPVLTSFGKVFHLEKRWKLVREMGSGAYGVVISAADEISGETVAIKQVTRVFDKAQLAKRALREITLLRHFANHENITGMIDLDAISADFNEIYIFMEPMEADLHQIIKSGQQLTTEHVQYFLYQLLRGMKYIHTAGVVHRDLKPGNLLVNADCELKICDFGLSRGFDQRDDENATQMTEYVATRWYRAPEIMLAFRRYGTAIDVWSIGCIFAELMTGKTLFKGKDYVDQLNKILEILGSPDEHVITRIGSDRAQAYVRSLPYKKKVPFNKVLPTADAEALDLLKKMLLFDPAERITVIDALAHPWLAAYHDTTDEPACAAPFERWRELEELETIEQFREALWNEIEDYRREARWSGHLSRGASIGGSPATSSRLSRGRGAEESTPETQPAVVVNGSESASVPSKVSSPERNRALDLPIVEEEDEVAPVDPLVSYARRSTLVRNGSTFSVHSPMVRSQRAASIYESGGDTHPGGTATTTVPLEGIPFPTTEGESYVFPSRARTISYASGEPTRKLLRTLSTLSIHESGEGLPGGLAGVAPIGKFIAENRTTDAPPSEIPEEFAAEWSTPGQRTTGKNSPPKSAPHKKKVFHIEDSD